MKSRLKSVCEFLGSKLLATKVKPHHIESWLMDRYPGANPTYRNTLIGSVKGAFAWGTRMGHLDADPIASMPKPTPLIREEFIPYEEWPRLLAAASPDVRDMLQFCLETGARAEEVFKIEARHVTESKISLERQLAKGRKKRRQIWLSEKAKAIISGLLAKHPEGHLFRSGKGNPWDSCSTNCAMRRLSAKFGRPVCLTMMRHSFAHHRLTSGQDLATVAALMGHCDGRMLTSRYGHLTANDDYMSRAASLA